MPDLQVLGSAETDELAENVQHFHVPATIVYQYYDHPFQIIHVNTVLDLILTQRLHQYGLTKL